MPPAPVARLIRARTGDGLTLELEPSLVASSELAALDEKLQLGLR